MQRVAVLGLGTMGIGMALNLLKSFKVVGYNRSAERGRRLEEGGGRFLAEPAEAVRGADAVVACLANDAANRDVLLAPELLDALEPGSLVIDCGTTGPEVTAALAEACAARSVDFLDAPITGSKLGAESGRLTFMVGGPSERVDRARGLFEAMGKHVVHAGGRVGDGQRIKYCLNMTQAIVMQGVLEGYALARAQGLEPSALAEVFENSAGKTGVGSLKTPYLQNRDFEPHFRLDLMRKDL
ncbi:MAG: NAD(P)-dependent oxidoreductase, partial [Myxococcota bacterium]